MKYDLFDYQREAAVGVANNLLGALALRETTGASSSFALSAVTGSGKTVIATAVIEAFLQGSADLDVEARPNTTFLWVTDDPALNRQTRAKMLDSSDLMPPRTYVELDDGYLDPELLAGQVYFLNVQKLSRSSRLGRGGTNLRQFSFWEVVANTVAAGRTDLVLVLDEARRGMKRSKDRQTIVQRLIHGEHGSNPRMPVVWGISATVARFTAAMGDRTGWTTLPDVEVDLEKVRASGLVKDEIGLDQPDESGTFSTTLLRDAVRTTLDYEARWRAYCEAEGEPPVLPVLVVQVPDKADEDKLGEIVGVIEDEWPDLGADAIVHVFGEHEAIPLGSRTLAWTKPESIQGDSDVRVVLAKEAISTGWDCPRAEVLYSERPAKDATHIAQVVGRMVRQPLAYRVATDDTLNSVSCYLPLFDRKALTGIKDELEGKVAKDGEGQAGVARVVRSPKVFERNEAVDPEVFAFVETLPSIPTPDRTANPLRRAKALVRLLTDDARGKAMLPGAGAELTAKLMARLDGLAAEFAGEVAAGVEDLLTTDVRTSRLSTVGKSVGTATRQIATAGADVDRDTNRIIGAVKEGIGRDYLAHRVRAAGAGVDRRRLRVEVAALLRIGHVLDSVEAAATDWTRHQLETFAVEIKNTTGATRAAFAKVQEHTSEIEVLPIALRDNDKAATKDGSGKPLPRFEGHLYADDDGGYPAALNAWETEVVTTEVGRPSFVAWYRNPSVAAPNSLRIAYRTEADDWASLQVDFLIVSRRDDGSLAASIVDPHGDHLADAKAKLRALADYAEAHGDRFVRIESVAKTDRGLCTLDLLAPAVRDAVRAFEGGKVSALYESDLARPYR